MSSIPLIPIGEEQQKKHDLTFFEKYRVRHTDEQPIPDVVLSVNGQIVSTRKNIFGLSGQAGVGKTFTLSLIIACVLQKGVFQGALSSYLPKGKDKIILFDTEQSTFHISVVLNRIIKMGTTENQMDNLITYSFDSIRSSERRQFFEEIISQTDGVGLVLIDGIADLAVGGVNDEMVASDLFDDLRAFATKLDIAIGYVLHQNPSSEKMRGHLGTYGSNKSESVFQTSVAPDDDSVKIVGMQKSRNKKTTPFSFQISDDGLPEIMEETYVEPVTGRPKAKVLTDIERYSLLNTVYSVVKPEDGLQFNVLAERVRCAYIDTHGEISERRIADYLKYCKEMNWLVSDGHKKPYFLHPFK
jgi:hypothetical protein